MRNFMILLVTALCYFFTPWELRFCDGLKFHSGLRIALLIALLAFRWSCLAASSLCLGLKEERNGNVDNCSLACSYKLQGDINLSLYFFIIIF